MGRVDWIAICIWSAVLLLQLIFILWLQKTIINDVFKVKKHKNIAAFIIVFIIFGITFIYYFNIDYVFKIIFSNGAIISFFVLQFLVPILTYAILKIKRKKGISHEKLPEKVAN